MSCSSRLSMAVAAALLLASPPGFAHAEDPVKLKEVRLTDDGRLKREGCCADPGR
jgi:hypothetical protein